MRTTDTVLERRVASLLVVMLATSAMAAPAPQSAHPADTARYLVQAPTLTLAQQDVQQVGGTLERNLDVIHAVSAYLDAAQVAQLRARSDVRVFADRSMHTESLGSLLGSVTSTVQNVTNTAVATVATNPLVTTVAAVTTPVTSAVTPLAQPLVSPLVSPVVAGMSSNTALTDGTGVKANTLLYQTNYPAEVGANTLQQQGITGRGVTIAMLDSGLWEDPSQNYGARVLATMDVTNGGSGPVTGDPYGHGTHITSTAAGGAENLSLNYLSIAPQANLVIVRAFDGQGGGRYVDVIAGLNWIIANQHKYNIRIINLSFGSTPESYYWNDPLDQAVMAAWQAGIVVVVAAGNSGPGPMTIGVPGNVPYVITVGALTDNYTPNNAANFSLASFSSTGPTYEGFVKPEVVAPGGHIAASMSSSSYLANIDPNSMSVGEQMFTMSGTSMATAVTSGVVALMLQANPALTPDNVKCRLLASAAPAVTSSGALAYTVFQQGAGFINAVRAVNSTATGCANQGLNVAADLAGTQHFGGPANENADGDFYIMNMAGSTWGTPLPGDGMTWSGGYAWDQGYDWSSGYVWTSMYAWSKSYTWSTMYAWSKQYAWSKGYCWSTSVPWWQGAPGSASFTSAPTSILPWVPNQ
ncbi:MAG TPA: S8 family peptidase [Steroidobacteraceae bacterium]|jgi:serine protease AprX|nr:S8 family peptidase [Steroidobacteraceae bacterium]